MNLIERVEQSKLSGDYHLLMNAENPLISQFVADAQNDFEQTNYFDQLQNFNLVIGKFDCPYNPNLSFEAAEYENILPSIQISNHGRMKSLVRCAHITNATTGLNDPNVVALFPENFYKHKVKNEDLIYYFSNRFCQRHRNISQKLVKQFDIKLLSPLLELTDKKIEVLISNWVYLHEYFHRLGQLPIPEYLYEKSGRLTAGVEELRVDLHTMKYCLDHSNDENDDYFLTFLFVFSERILSYPIHRNLDSFDSLSSIISSHELEVIKNQTIQINDNRYKEIHSLIEKITRWEKKAFKEAAKQLRRKSLTDQIQNYLNNCTHEYDFFYALKKEFFK